MRNLRLTRTIGSGSFGTVYQAELSSGQGFRRQVAVKVLHRHQPDSDMFLSRIRDEARLLGLLQDAAILKVLDMVSRAGRDAVVMEYVDGVDLDTLAKGGHAPPPRVLAELGSEPAMVDLAVRLLRGQGTHVTCDVKHKHFTCDDGPLGQAAALPAKARR